jgi:hypothetical protein
MREALGLARGGLVDIELAGTGIHVQPVAGDSAREEDGLLVIPSTGTALEGSTVRSLIDDDRRRG